VQTVIEEQGHQLHDMHILGRQAIPPSCAGRHAAGPAVDPVSVKRQENVHFYNELLVTPYFVSPGGDKMMTAHNHEFHLKP
jgi:hypothetical protein